MRAPARKFEAHEQHVDGSQTDERLADFARELTDISRKHGFGITGTATLFEMEPVDQNLEYKVDERSNLVFK